MVPAIVALGLAVSYSAPAPDNDYRRVRRIVDVMSEVDANFYRKLSDDEWKQFVENMINGGLHELDPHAQYMNADQLKQFESESEGSFGGVGIQLDLDRDTKFLKVGSPMPGTPAYDAGIIAGDLIVKVDGQPTDQLKLDKLSPEELKFPEREKQIAAAQKVIKGEPGTEVTLTMRRAGRKPPDQDVTLKRAAIPYHPVTGFRRRADDPSKWEWFVDKPNGIGYVRLSTFNELTTKELRAALEEIEREGGKALVIDLRDNGGGLLNQAIDVCSTFLSEGKPIVSTHGRDPGRTRDFTAKKDAEMFRPAEQHPIVVLMNDQSASASEIVASALQDNKRAVIVGERSYGKGSVQKLLRLGGEGDQKAAVKLTTETYWRPSGKNMDRRLVEKEKDKDKANEWGVMPDTEVKTTLEEKARAEIERFKRDWVAGKPSVVGPNPPPAPTPPIRKGPDGKPVIDITKPFTDRVLDTAIDTLKKKLGGAGAAPPPPARIVPQPVFG
jgi:carboxyl-terminal processing protease